MRKIPKIKVFHPAFLLKTFIKIGTQADEILRIANELALKDNIVPTHEEVWVESRANLLKKVIFTDIWHNNSSSSKENSMR